MSQSQYSTSFGQITLTVKPDMMKAAAENLEKITKKSEQSFDQMLQTVKETARYWQGDAGEHERQLFDNQQENFRNVLNNLYNYAKELRIITSVYETGEENIKGAAASLQTNVLE